MTVNATSTRQLDIDAIIRRSYQFAGLMEAQQGPGTPQWAAKAAMAQDFLEMEVDALQAEAVFSWDTAYYEVTVVAGTATYVLPTDTMDVIGNGMFALTDEDTQTQARALLRDEYLSLSAKEAEGRPFAFYTDRVSGFTLHLWPVPDAGGTLTIQRRRLLGDFNDRSKTADLERFWVKYLWCILAHHLAVASSREVPFCGYLRSVANDALKVAKAYTRQRPPTQMRMAHQTGWSR